MKEMYKLIILFLLFVVSCSNSSEEIIETVEPIETTTTTTTTTTTMVTTTTTSPKDILPEVSITCEPLESDEVGYQTFKFEVRTGTNEITVLNIVSWFDSSRTDDLFFYDDLPEPGDSKEFGYSVDSSFSQYEIEILVMDSKENFATDYCLYENTP